MNTEYSEPTHSLIGLLEHEDTTIRTKALAMLCEAYAADDRIYATVTQAWESTGAEEAFPEFPMLSYFPVPPEKVASSIRLATKMAQDRKLTDKTARCGGKLLEQLTWLGPQLLSGFLSELTEACKTSKIFFRVPLERWRTQASMLGQTSSELCEALDDSIAQLIVNEENQEAWMTGESALNILRQRFPDVVDIGEAVANAPEKGSALHSFQIAIKSLCQFPALDTEEPLSGHLHDSREAVHASTVEALVRNGSAKAAARLLLAIPEAPSNNRSWIVRGLQRIRAFGLAEELAKVRAQVVDPRLWLMLLIAEIHQLDPSSMDRLAFDVRRLAIRSDAVLDSLRVFLAIHDPDSETHLATAMKDYKLTAK